MVSHGTHFSGGWVTTLDNSTPVTRETLDYSASIFVIDAAGLLYASHTDGTYLARDEPCRALTLLLMMS